jgi:hypothetical protein
MPGPATSDVAADPAEDEPPVTVDAIRATHRDCAVTDLGGSYLAARVWHDGQQLVRVATPDEPTDRLAALPAGQPMPPLEIPCLT